MELKDFETLLQAQEHFEITPRLMSTDMMTSYLDDHGLLIHFQDSIKSAERATIMAIGAGSEFNFTKGHKIGDRHLARLDDIINDVDLPPALKPFIIKMKQSLIDYCTKSTKPFEICTQAKFNMAKGLYKSVTLEYQAGKQMVLTLNTNLAERVAATVWITETGFEAENAGRNVYIQSANKYRIDMGGKKSGEYEIRVPLLDADFTVELI